MASNITTNLDQIAENKNMEQTNPSTSCPKEMDCPSPLMPCDEYSDGAPLSDVDCVRLLPPDLKFMWAKMDQTEKEELREMLKIREYFKKECERPAKEKQERFIRCCIANEVAQVLEKDLAEVKEELKKEKNVEQGLKNDLQEDEVDLEGCLMQLLKIKDADALKKENKISHRAAELLQKKVVKYQEDIYQRVLEQRKFNDRMELVIKQLKIIYDAVQNNSLQTPQQLEEIKERLVECQFESPLHDEDEEEINKLDVEEVIPKK